MKIRPPRHLVILSIWRAVLGILDIWYFAHMQLLLIKHLSKNLERFPALQVSIY